MILSLLVSFTIALGVLPFLSPLLYFIVSFSRTNLKVCDVKEAQEIEFNLVQIGDGVQNCITLYDKALTLVGDVDYFSK